MAKSKVEPRLSVPVRRLRAAVARFLRVLTSKKRADAERLSPGSGGDHLMKPQGAGQSEIAACDMAGELRSWGLKRDAAGGWRNPTQDGSVTIGGVSKLSPVGRAAARHWRIPDAPQGNIRDQDDFSNTSKIMDAIDSEIFEKDGEAKWVSTLSCPALDEPAAKEEAFDGPAEGEASCVPLTDTNAEQEPGAPAEDSAEQQFLPKYSPLPALSTSGTCDQLLEMLDHIAGLDTEVLITGPPGAEMTRYARYLHLRSQRADRPFVPVCCGRDGQGLIDGELFGRGGDAKSDCFIAKAEGGTLFLDEVDQLPLGAQIKLLRFLEKKEYRPLGEARIRRADVRLIMAVSAGPAEALGEKPLLPELNSRLRLTAVEVRTTADQSEEFPLLSPTFTSDYDGT